LKYGSQNLRVFQQIRRWEEIIIPKNGHELARVIPNKQPKAPQAMKLMKKKLFALDFEDALPENI
jgi:antitoxin (DNA-binding transcriptional repressor) of toxin-antitoxin stability system